MLKGLHRRLRARPQATICLIIFVLCCLIYFANENPYITSNDNVPSALLALNWFEYNTLNFDAFRTEAYNQSIGSVGTPYYFAEAPNGHLISTYPPGTALLSFPIYAVLYAGLRLSEWFQSVTSGTPVDLLDVTSTDSFPIIYSFQKIASTILAAFTAVLFYLLVRLKFKLEVCILATFIFAFATSSWSINSQGLWQHSTSNLALLCIMLCLFKANRTTGMPQNLALLMAGVFSGLMPGIRPTSSLFMLVAIVYVGLLYSRSFERLPAWLTQQEPVLAVSLRPEKEGFGKEPVSLSNQPGFLKDVAAGSEKLLFFGLGLLSLCFNAAWNFYYFGVSLRNFIYGGYSRFSGNEDFAQSFYVFSWEQFQTGFWGHLTSPSRGLLIFSPIVILALPGLYHVWKQRQGKDEKLVLGMAIAIFILFIQYCFFIVWHGGWSYGPRYMTDLLPILCLLLTYYLAHFFQQIGRLHRGVAGGVLALILALTFYSTFPEIVGVFATPHWNGIPTIADTHMFWRWRDSQIERHAWHLWFKLTRPLGDGADYVQQFMGGVQQVEQVNGEPYRAPLTLARGKRPGVFRANLVVQVKNLGTEQWYGYKRGNDWTIPTVRMRLYASDRPDTPVMEPQYLYVGENVKPGEIGLAEGLLRVELVPGSYQLVMEMMLPNREPASDLHPLYSVPVQVAD